jgi:nucleotide-binding universal stress UspA family protein
MFKKILLPVENSSYGAAIVAYVRDLALRGGASVVVIHVADGFAARNLKELSLRESEEMRDDREYVERVARTLSEAGVSADCVLAAGDPAREIREFAEREGCDLIAMATHGHRFFKDLLFGSVATEVRHSSRVPVLLVLGKPERGAPRPPAA